MSVDRDNLPPQGPTKSTDRFNSESKPLSQCPIDEGVRKSGGVSYGRLTPPKSRSEEGNLIGRYGSGPTNRSIAMDMDEENVDQEWSRSPRSSTTSKKPSPRSHRSFGSRIFEDSWIWEFVGWLMGAACVAAIVVILNTYNGRPIPRWSSGITLNALISVFTSIAKIALLFPIAQSIGQLKWVWFATGTRNLEDFEVFDNASKGVGGSIQLLGKPKGRYWAILGAIAMITSTMLEPFTQQIISFPQKLSPFSGTATTASIAYSHNFNVGVPSSFGRIGGLSQVETTGHLDASMILSIHTGTFQPINASIGPLAPECTTGNCTFPEYLSVAVCSTGTDVTHLLGQNCNVSAIPSTTTCDHTLPNGMFLGPDGAVLNVSTNIFPTLIFSNITRPAADIFTIYRETGTSTIKAAEFVLEYCVKRYHTVVSDGRALTTDLATYTEYTTGHWDPILKLNSSTLVFNVPNTPTTFNVTKLTQAGVGEFMRDFFVGSVRSPSNGPVVPVSAAGVMSFDITGPVSRAIEYSPSNQAGIQRLLDNVAMSITNNIRSRNDNAMGTPQQGIAYAVVTFVRVDWPWISMLAMLVLMVLVLLVSTVVQSWRTKTKLWKSSSLAVLRAGTMADEALRMEWGTGGMERLGLLQSEGAELGIRLVNETGGAGWRLVKG